MKILIVDDSKAIMAIVRKSLEKEGFVEDSFQYAANGVDALQIALEWKPDLILTDWHMPGMSGLEMMQAIRQQASSQPLIGVITTERSEDRLREAKSNGATFILHKPFEYHELGQAIRQAVCDDLNRKPVNPALSRVDIQPQSRIEGDLIRHVSPNAQLILNPDMVIDELVRPFQIVFLGFEGMSNIRAVIVLDAPAIRLFANSGGEISDQPLQQSINRILASRHAIFDGEQIDALKVLRNTRIDRPNSKFTELLSNPAGRHSMTIRQPPREDARMVVIMR